MRCEIILAKRKKLIYRFELKWKKKTFWRNCSWETFSVIRSFINIWLTQLMAMGYDNYLEDQYKVPILAKILHSLPHLNITFHRTNNTFRPTDEIYLEVRRNEIRRKIDKTEFSQKTCFVFCRVWEFWDRFLQQRSSYPSFVCCFIWCRDAATVSRVRHTPSPASKLLYQS